MSFDVVSYVMGDKSGFGRGYEEGYEEGSQAGVVVIESGVNCTDDGDGNITIEEE